MHLAYTLKLGELGKDQPQRILHPLVWILLDPVAPSPHVARCDTEKQRPAARLLLQCFVRPLAKERQLELAHRSFHAEQ